MALSAFGARRFQRPPLIQAPQQVSLDSGGFNLEKGMSLTDLISLFQQLQGKGQEQGRRFQRKPLVDPDDEGEIGGSFDLGSGSSGINLSSILALFGLGGGGQ